MLAEAWVALHPLQIFRGFGGGGSFPPFPPLATTLVCTVLNSYTSVVLLAVQYWRRRARESHLQLVRQLLTLDPIAERVGMSCNAQADELFLADLSNRVARATRARANADADDTRYVYSVCHMRDSDTVLVCSRECGPDNTSANWLVALSRRGGGGEWREAHRLQTEGATLSDSRVLIGQFYSDYVELLRVQSGPRIARVHSIRVPQAYIYFSATCGSDGDTYVAMAYEDESGRVFRLVGDRLDKMARIRLEKPDLLLWVAHQCAQRRRGTRAEWRTTRTQLTTHRRYCRLQSVELVCIRRRARSV